MRTQKEIFEIVEAGRQRIKELLASKVAQSTSDGYVREYNRLVGDEGAEPEELWSAICRTSSKSTYRRRVAAVLHCCKAQLQEALRQQDAAQRERDRESLDYHVSLIENVIGIIGIIEKHRGACPLDSPRRRQSKRSDLRKLPPDWREQLHGQFINSKYELTYLVEAVSGCRPSELEKGVKVVLTENTLTIRIDNGIKVTETKGQPWREIRYRIEQNSHPLIKALANVCRKQGNSVSEIIVGIEKSTNWRAALSAAGQKIWPRLPFRICPYHLRNAAASDFKCSGLGDEGVSAALGHCVDKTASLYGQFQISRGGQGLSPEAIRAARSILNTRTPVPNEILALSKP